MLTPFALKNACACPPPLALVLDEVPAYPEARYLLGFNEPNIVTQSNLTAAEACDQWPLLEAAAAKKNLSLGSPAVNHCHFEPQGHCSQDPVEWLDAFFGACPSAGASVKFIAAHYYGCNASDIVRFVQQLSAGFGGKPVWLTEFACSYHDEATNLRFMRELLPQLDALPAGVLQRYSWYASRTDQTSGPGNGRNANATLLRPGSTELSTLGEYYIA